MNRTLDKLFLYFLTYILFFQITDIFVPKILFLLLLIFCISGFLYYFDSEYTLYFGGTLFLFLCLYDSNSFFFFPLLAYDAFYKKSYRCLAIYLAPLLWTFFFFQSITQVLSLSCLSFLSFFLANNTRKIYQYKQEIMHLKDDSRELEFLTMKQQQQSNERHTNELHIAKLQERNRIAREIHDNVGHMLSRSILVTGALKVMNQQSDLAETIDTLKNSLDDAMNSIRESVHDLKDDSFDLEAMIQSTLAYYSKYELKFQYMVESKISLDLKYAILSIIKEALSNTEKHSNATKINILFQEQSLGYRLLIEDNGYFISLAQSQSKTNLLLNSTKNGIGLENMKERVHSFDGNIRISCENGFTISIFIPKN